MENFTPKDRKSISLYEGDIVEVVEKSDSGWWFVTCTSGTGWVPANFLRSLDGGEDLMQQCGKSEFAGFGLWIMREFVGVCLFGGPSPILAGQLRILNFGVSGLHHTVFSHVAVDVYLSKVNTYTHPSS